MARAGFKKLPPSLLEISDKRLVDIVTKHIEDQVDPEFTIDLRLLGSAPRAAQTVFWLWRFQCEACISGMDSFILQSLGMYSPQIHAALKAADATEVMHLLEAAIPLALAGSAEFKRSPNLSWFKQFPQIGEFKELQSLNGPGFRLGKDLTERMATYIRSNREELFEE